MPPNIASSLVRYLQWLFHIGVASLRPHENDRATLRTRELKRSMSEIDTPVRETPPFPIRVNRMSIHCRWGTKMQLTNEDLRGVISTCEIRESWQRTGVVDTAFKRGLKKRTSCELEAK